MKSEVIAIITVGILATGTLGGLAATLTNGVSAKIDAVGESLSVRVDGVSSGVAGIEARLDDIDGRVKSVETVLLNQGHRLATLESAALKTPAIVGWGKYYQMLPVIEDDVGVAVDVFAPVISPDASAPPLLEPSD